MKTVLLLIAIAIVTSTTFIAQPKVVHFKKLQECLPARDLSGLKRAKPTGTTQTAMGMSTSEAAVRYARENSGDSDVPDTTQPKTIEVKIADMVMMPYALMAFGYQQGYENETEDGYEKSVTVKEKYKGLEKGKTGDYKSCELSFGVANRFIVTIEAHGYPDSKILATVLDAMDLAKLEKLE